MVRNMVSALLSLAVALLFLARGPARLILTDNSEKKRDPREGHGMREMVGRRNNERD